MNGCCIWAAALVAAYLIGSIPFGWIVGRLRGHDIRNEGSKNIGATNVFRCVGKKWGVLAFILDFLKGLIPTLLADRYACSHLSLAGAEYFAFMTGVMAVVGHMFTCFMKFKGGKGVATGFGLLMGIIPALAGTAFGLFLLMVLISHYISVGSIIAAAFLGIAVWFPIPGLNPVPPPAAVCALVTALTAFVVYKHKANMVRLAAGCENKIW